MIDNNKSFEIDMNGELPAPTVQGMYMVPEVLLVQNIEAYRPSCVAIGPLHRGSPQLQEMVAVKVAYVSHRLDRKGGIVEETAKECMEAMLKLELRVEECYAQRPQLLSPQSRIAEMMLIDDGCFIIELLYRNSVEMCDPNLQNSLKLHQVKHDLLLLENQISFFVLEELFGLTVEVEAREFSLPNRVFSFFPEMMGLAFGVVEITVDIYPFHILHFLHLCCLPPSSQDARMYKHTEKPRFKYSATKLQRVGVKFWAHNNRGDLFHLKFSTDRRCFCLWRRGHFKIPHFSITESTESFLRNSIAFERCCPVINNYFTSHAVAMSILLGSAEDLRLLEEAGIIRNHLDSCEAVSELFNNITKDETVVRNQFLLYKDLWMGVMGFCSPWRLALSNVTTQMAVMAAIVLNIITILSSVYTVLSYYNN